MQNRRFSAARGLLLWSLAAVWIFPPFPAGANTTPPAREELLATAYSGSEQLKYDISWMGILKTGELTMRIEPLPSGEEERLRVSVTARSAGLLALFYPVEDRFEMIVEGRDRLPVSLTMQQSEGKRKGRRTTQYDQEGLEVTSIKDEEQPVIYPIEGPVHNEFSSFLILRALPLTEGERVIVPTFADDKRHEIAVQVEKLEMIGDQPVFRVEPQLTFKGLYEKVGNPVIWYTADERRLPIRIEAKVKIGSLAAELSEYHRLETLASYP